VDEGYRIGSLSFALYKKFDAKAWLARLSAIYFDLVHNWVRPIEESRKPLDYAYRAGLESGDIECAFACAILSWFMRFDSTPLPDLELEMEILTERMELYGQKTFILMTKSARQLIHNLMGLGDGDVIDLRGKIVDAAIMEEINSIHALFTWNHAHRLVLNYLFGRYSEAAQHAKFARELGNSFFGPVRGAWIVFLCGLAVVADARQKQRRRAPYARMYSNLLRRWAAKGEPRYFLGKHYLLEAELAVLTGNRVNAFILYATAIATSREEKLIMQVALASERTARFLLEQGDNERATTFFHDALTMYNEWGASAKALHLENEINELGLG
jgi:hypothetical protein